MLEALQYSDNAFITLTYDDDRLPVTAEGLPTLVPKHVQDWLKRFRKRIEPVRIRYFACGEYGDTTERPHYHVAVFGYPTCSRGRTDHRKISCCPRCDLVKDTWGFGGVDLGTLEVNSAQYIAGYVTKKLTAKDDYRLNGRYPEFARMSLRPGIGADAMHEIASAVMEFDLAASEGDVPSALRHGSRILPLGRYLRRKLREYCGRDPGTPDHVLEKMAEEMGPLREAAFENSESFSSVIVKAADGKVAQMEARQRIFKKDRPL